MATAPSPARGPRIQAPPPVAAGGRGPPPGRSLTFHAVGREETDVAGLQGVLVGELRGAGLGFRLACQGGVVHLRRKAVWGHPTGRRACGDTAVS